MSVDVELRIAREKDFHDERFATDTRASVARFYDGEDAARRRYADLVVAPEPGLRALEYGCAIGGAAFDLAAGGAAVVGIDISTTAIDRAREEARRRGLTTLRFEEMDAERLTFPDASFDLVFGTGILHHLDIDRAMSEIRRVLVPGGRAVFLEPLGHNPLINLFRRLTPALRTADEHPLVVRDLTAIESRFSAATFDHYTLVSLATVPFRTRRGGRELHRALERLDQWVFTRVPGLRRHAWVVVVSVVRG